MTWGAIRNAIAIWAGLILLVTAGAVAGTLARSGDAAGESAAAADPPVAPPRVLVSPQPTVDGVFRHPGILVSGQQLDFVRERVSKGDHPWAEAFAVMEISPYASKDWVPKPRAVIDCGPFSTPDIGCSDESSDAVAAYTHALLWYITGDRANAEKAVEILDAWSGVVKRHTNRNAPLQAAWSAASFVRAAEILRYTYDGWPRARVNRAVSMFRTVYLPLVKAGAPQAGGNWELILLDAAVSIAVFTDDRPLFDQTLAKTRARARAFIYLTSDGAYPRMPNGSGSRSAMVSFWYGQSTFVDGLSQETCRDFGHTAWGFVALAHIAETAWLQGVDLYDQVRRRLVAALEFHATYELGEAVPAWLCGGKVELGLRPLPEVAYHHYAFRQGLAMPRTGQFTEPRRPENASFFFGWETLTHANNPF
jgi:hypothetical protein